MCLCVCVCVCAHPHVCMRVYVGVCMLGGKAVSLSPYRDQLGKTLRKLHLRQRAMIAELAETFCIKQV